MPRPDRAGLAPEVAAFIRAQPRELPYSALAAACRARFGAEAPDAEAIQSWWLRFGIGDGGGRSAIERDAELRAFIMDRIGRQSAMDIWRGLGAAFPADRRPKRSSFYRFHKAALAEAKGKAAAARRPRSGGRTGRQAPAGPQG